MQKMKRLAENAVTASVADGKMRIVLQLYEGD
jgi:hypothetical protein